MKAKERAVRLEVLGARGAPPSPSRSGFESHTGLGNLEKPEHPPRFGRDVLHG